MPKQTTLVFPRVRLAAILLLSLVLSQMQAAFALTAYRFNRDLGLGINLGNALDAPKEGDWGVTLDAEYFRFIKKGGFSHVRLPVRWSSHAELKAPYKIDPAFIDRVHWAIRQARDNNLNVVLDMHHYDDFEGDPEGHRARFLALWQQISEEFKSEPDEVAFEIYNEPAKKISASFWNDLFAEVLAMVRKNNPQRIIVVGPVHWNSISALDTLKLPDDKNLIVTVHYYEPFHFTHQGAEWVGPESKKWLGTTWPVNRKQMGDISADFKKAKNWAETNHRQMYLGEFGAYEKADMDSRARWTYLVSSAARWCNFSMAYWEFCSGFGAYDKSTGSWHEPLLQALHPGKETGRCPWYKPLLPTKSGH